MPTTRAGAPGAGGTSGSQVLAQALADAIAYREPGSPSDCTGCENCPDAALCDDHAADLDLIDAYLALARELGIEVEL